MKKMAGIALVLFLAVVLFSACGDEGGGTGAERADGEFEVGIIKLMEHPALDAAHEGFVAALEAEGINVNYDYHNAQGDTATLGTIAQRFVSSDVDLVLAIATPSAQAIANATETIPIVGTAITSFEAAGLVESNDAPGFNVTGTSDMNPVAEQIDLMLEFMPEIQTIGILYSSAEPNSVVQAGMAREAAEALGLSVESGTVAATADIQQVATSVANRVDAIYIPTDNTHAGAMSLIGQISMETGTPVFAGEGNMVMGGGIATVGIDYFDLGFQAGIMAAQILRGEAEPGAMPIQFAQSFDYTVNGFMLEQMGLIVPPRLFDYIRWE